jgi:ribosome maturation factor RimP
VTATPRVLALLEPVVTAAGFDLEDLTVSAAVLVDEQDPTLLGTSYVLEVSSPGVDRPLTEQRHWRRNTGRLVAATLRDGSTVEGRITAVDETGVTVDEQRVLAWSEVARGSVQVEFNRKDETGPHDEDDELDEVDEEDGE